MSFPVTDWQFWTVTFAALGSLWVLVKPFLPAGENDSPGGACSHCGVAPGSPCGREDAGHQGLVTLGGRGRAG